MTLQVLPFITYVFTVIYYLRLYGHFHSRPQQYQLSRLWYGTGVCKNSPLSAWYILRLFPGYAWYRSCFRGFGKCGSRAASNPEICRSRLYRLARLAFCKKAFSAENFGRERGRKSAFAQGLILQVVNIKVLIYGLTVFTLFINPVYENIFILMHFSLFLAGCSFVSISLWTAIGGSLNRFFSNSPIKRGFFLVSSLLLPHSCLSDSV